MSMMLPPEAPPGLPFPPGGQDTPPPPMDAMSGTPVPGDQGIEGLLAALGGGGGGPPGMGGPPGLGPGPEEAPPDEEPMSSIDHIQQAMKHLMMAMAGEDDDERGHGITKGMGTLQGILAGEKKKQAQLGALGG